MPASDKRVAANRVNAAKSTGPRTPEGKQKSRLNAVVHGLTAQASVLPGEDQNELEALGRSVMWQLKPRGIVQRMMAERVISLTWKLRRVARAEEEIAWEADCNRDVEWHRGLGFAEAHPIFKPLVGPRPRPRDAGALLADSMWERGEKSGSDPRMQRISQYELKLDGALRAAMRELLKLQKEAAAFEEVEEEDAAEWFDGENEPNAGAETVEAPGQGQAEDDPGLRCAAPAACGDA